MSRTAHHEEELQGDLGVPRTASLLHRGDRPATLHDTHLLADLRGVDKSPIQLDLRVQIPTGGLQLWVNADAERAGPGHSVQSAVSHPNLILRLAGSVPSIDATECNDPGVGVVLLQEDGAVLRGSGVNGYHNGSI